MNSNRTLSDWLRDTHLVPGAAAHLARAVVNLGVRYPSVFSNAFIAAPPANGAETVLVTTPPLTLPLDFAQVLLFWFLDIQSGASTTNYIVNIRRGTTTGGTGIYLGPSQPLPVAGQRFWTAGCFVDTPGAVAGQQYSLSLSGVATTGAWAAGVAQTLLAFSL